MKRTLALFLVVAFLFSFVTQALAAKGKKAAGSSIAVSGKFNRAKNSANVYFGGLKNVSRVSYTLIYQGSDLTRGVQGSFSPGKKTSYSTNIYLGSCSGKTCIPDRNIKDIRVETVVKFKNGKSSKKTIKIK